MYRVVMERASTLRSCPSLSGRHQRAHDVLAAADARAPTQDAHTFDPPEESTFTTASRAAKRTSISRNAAYVDEPYKTMLELIAATGLRIGELLAVRWRALDLEIGTLALRARGMRAEKGVSSVGYCRVEDARRAHRCAVGRASHRLAPEPSSATPLEDRMRQTLRCDVLSEASGSRRDSRNPEGARLP
jgi:integrase